MLKGLVVLAAVMIAVNAGNHAMAAAEPITIAQGGKTSYAIIVPDDAIPAERTAASELVDYLEQISGAKLEIRDESKAPAGAATIYVGPGKRAKALAAGVAWDQLGHDGIVMKTVGNDLVLAGGRPRGTLYAVYQFLEEFQHVRWWTSQETDVPKSDRVTAPAALDRVYVPKIRYREVYNHDAMRRDSHFAACLKLNGQHMTMGREFGGHYTLIGWCHTFYHLLPPGEFFDKHPEWYSLQKGKREPGGGQLCLSNDAMRAKLTERVLERVRKNPDAGMISVSQNDCHGACQCEPCQKNVQEEGSEAGPLIRFVNAVAADVAKEYPDFLVETLAYQYTRKPPKKTKPSKNVLVRLCSIECDFSHPLSAPSNKTFADDLRQWAAISPKLFIWNYVTNFSNYLIPHPNFEPIAEDVRLFSESNVIGVFQQGDAFNGLAGDMLPLRTWVHAKIMWDPKQDPRRLRDEFLNGYFKAAGPMLAQYMDLVNSVAKRDGFTKGCYGAEPSYISTDMLAKMNELFDRAQKAVAGDEALSRRVRRERLVLDHLNILSYPFQKRADELKVQGKPARTVVDEYEKLVSAFASSAKEMGVRNFAEGQDFASYVPGLMGRANQFAPVELPKYGAKLAANQFEIQEDRFYLFREGQRADRVIDRKASNGRAARMSGDHTDWAIQFHLPKDSPLVGKGTWKCYIVIRCETTDRSGTAFWYGLHDPDRNVFVARTPVSADVVSDGEYRTYAIWVDELKPNMYFWISPAANPNVKSIYVDRMFISKSR